MKKQGFATMTPERHRELCASGGKEAHARGKAHEFTSEEARVAGAKGGHAVSQNREHMRVIGRKGGQRVGQDKGHMAKIGVIGGKKVSSNVEHMRALGRKGGRAKVRHHDPSGGPIGPTCEHGFFVDCGRCFDTQVIW